MQQQRVSLGLSDHIPILLCTNKAKKQGRLFRYERAWFRQGFGLKMVDGGSNISFCMPHIMKKLQWVRGRMKAWSKETLGAAATIRQRLLRRIEELDIQNDLGELHEVDREQWADIKKQ